MLKMWTVWKVVSTPTQYRQSTKFLSLFSPEKKIHKLFYKNITRITKIRPITN